MDLSSGKRTRVLGVELKSAEFLDKYKKSGDVYANIWIDERMKVSTRMVHCNKRAPSPIWNQKFALSVPHNFFNNNNVDDEDKYSVKCEIICVPKYRGDIVLGFAKCKLGPLFPELGKLDEISEKEKVDENPNYDTDEEGSVGRESFASTLSDIDDEDCETHVHDHEDNHAERREEKIALPKEITKSVSLDIFKSKESGSVKRGVLNVEMTVGTKCIKRIGEQSGPQPTIAMDYDEFMMKTQYHEENKKHKGSLFVCFGPTNTKE